MLLFAAVTMDWFRVKSRWWENLRAARRRRAAVPAGLLHGPARRPSTSPRRRRESYDVARDTPTGDRLVLAIKGTTIEGDEVQKTVAVDLGDAGADGRKRLADAGLTLAVAGDRMQIAGVKFGSRARKSGVEPGMGDRANRACRRGGRRALVLPPGAGPRRDRLVGRRGAACPRKGRSAVARAHPRIALIHALAQSIAPVNAELDRVWPGCVRMNLLDDSLSADLAANPAGLDDAMTARFIALGELRVGTGVRGILFTCSAFGPCIDAVGRRLAGDPGAEAQRGDDRRRREAGRRIGLVASFAPTLASMPAEFPADVTVVPVLADGALDALTYGDHALARPTRRAKPRSAPRHRAATSSRSRSSASHAPPARSGSAVRAPVLTTVGSAVRLLRERVEARMPE